MTYAAGTSVSVEKSKFELDTLLKKHGASQRAFADDDTGGRAVVVFTLSGRQYRLEVPLPRRDDFKPRTYGDGGKLLPKEQRVDEPRGWRAWGATSRDAWVQSRYEQATRERWRAVLLLVKAKLEIVALGLSSVEKEFLADLVLSDGRRVHDALKAPIESMYATGKMPPLLGTGDEQ